jgi:hypothetical protein
MALVNINAGEVVGEVMKGLDGLFTSDEERAAARLAADKVANQPHILQALTNLESAKHPSLFVAGARPALLWLCVACLAYIWIGRDLIVMALMLSGNGFVVDDLPDIASGDLMTLVLALLGLGGMRTLEGIKGVKRDNLRASVPNIVSKPSAGLEQWILSRGIDIKPGVKVEGLDAATMGPVLTSALTVWEGIARRPTITSALDGTHSANSLHYKGRALDFRTRDLSEAEKQQVFERMKAQLGLDYDVVLEDTHLHIEYDPKG